LKEGDEVELEIKERARDGRGIARLRGCIIFVEGASVGEKVRVRITRLAARHVHAQIIRHLGQ
jgi:predicted RNA-binding protein with TRAM domain